MKSLKALNTIILLISTFSTLYSQEGIKHYNEGINLLKAKEFEKAIKVFSNGIKANDITKSINYYGRAYAYFESKQFEKAKSDIESSLKTEMINKESINSNIYWLKGMVASAEGYKELEIQSYKKAIEYSPEDYRLRTTLSMSLIENNEPQKALEILVVL
jgi:tetratricopeptide (TPR) repeat protein